MQVNHVGGAIEYEVYPGHIHQLILSDEPLDGEAIEDYANELAEAVLICNEDRHDGHGRTHTMDDAMKAFAKASEELSSKSISEFKAEIAELDRKIHVYKKWGKKQVPEAALFFNQDGEEILMTVGMNGDPVFQKPRKPVLRDLVPTPEQAGAQRDKYGMGWTAKRHLKAETKLRRIK